jgi:divalent metal cation (Fe/Co/Zn/Cd) transporter
LLGFGVDSFVETASGAILIWRLRAEAGVTDPRAVERLDRTAHRGVGLSLFALAAYVAFEAARALWSGERPDPSWVGTAVTAISIGVMWWLARAKRRAAMMLGS